MADAAAVVQALRERGLTIAMGESLTAGLVAATLADVPGCSDVLRGAVVAYAADVKASALGVTDSALAAGLVSAEVARELASGAARVLGADVGIGTTGVAGPDPHDGAAVGTVWIAVSAPGGHHAPGTATARLLTLGGSRADIRRQTVEACWDLALAVLSGRE